MKWTKRHSENAVEARRRLRIARIELPDESNTAAQPRRRLARFTLQLRDNQRGDSLTLNLYALPRPNRWICEHGEFSSSHRGKAIGLILQAV